MTVLFVARFKNYSHNYLDSRFATLIAYFHKVASMKLIGWAFQIRGETFYGVVSQFLLAFSAEQTPTLKVFKFGFIPWTELSLVQKAEILWKLNAFKRRFDNDLKIVLEIHELIQQVVDLKLPDQTRFSFSIEALGAGGIGGEGYLYIHDQRSKSAHFLIFQSMNSIADYKLPTYRGRVWTDCSIGMKRMFVKEFRSVIAQVKGELEYEQELS